MRLLLLVRTTVVLLLCTGAAKAADPMLLAETGGFLLGNAHRCDVSAERMLASPLVVEFLGRSAVWGCGGVELVIGSTG